MGKGDEQPALQVIVLVSPCLVESVMETMGVRSAYALSRVLHRGKAEFVFPCMFRILVFINVLFLR
jgi:hypothetical protein